MSHEPPHPEPAADAAQAAPSPYGPDRRAAERTERQLALLDGIAQDGAALIRIIRKQAEQANWCGSDGPQMFDQLARAVRQTIAFANKIDADARMTAEQRAAAYARHVAAEERAAASHAAKRLSAEVGRIAEEIERDVCGLRGGRSDRENLLSGLNERFHDKSVDDELNGRTYREILGTILEDLGASVDLSVFSEEELARVYGPARLRRLGRARAAGPAAPAGDTTEAAEAGEAATASEPGPPDVANGHDPPPA
jgi:hypothetical protein